jgi:hypothetical protein
MGLSANIPAVEAAQSLTFARAIAIAFGDGKSLASCVYLTTGDGRLAQNIEVQSAMRNMGNG